MNWIPRSKSSSRCKKGLRHAAACPAPNHLECPKFQRLIRVAGENRRKAKARSGPKTGRRD